MMDKKIIYADNAATSALSKKAFEAMLPFLRDDYANISQPYSFARHAKKAVKEAREIIAAAIGASPEEIYFTSGGSESNNWVINGGIEFEMDMVTSAIEHQSILRATNHASKIGYNVTYLPVNNEGLVDLPNLVKSLTVPGVLVSIMMANNEIGTIQHISELASVTRECNGIFHTDAVQAVGHIDIDVKSLGIDMLSASAHKFNGPKGIGFLYIRKGLKWPQLIYGGSQEFGFRAGTENIASIVGMASALKENIDNLAENSVYLTKLENVFIDELYRQGLQYIRNGHYRHIPGCVNVSFKEVDGETLLHRLDLKGIMISTGSACDSQETQVSHVIKAIGVDECFAKGTIRLSFGKQNTVEEVKEIAKMLGQIIHSLDESNSVNPKISVLPETLPQLPSRPETSIPHHRDKHFFIRTVGCNAEGKLKDGKIIILKGSLLRLDVTNTFDRIDYRNHIISKFCVKTDNGYLCNSDLPPMSPSGASGLVQARSSNGKRDWKDKNGTPLSEFLK